MIRAFGVLVFASIPWLGFGQSKETIVPSSRLQALADVIGGFNAIGSRASILRRAMKPEDALAFDAVLEDMMGALMAIPGIAPARSADPGPRCRQMPPRSGGSIDTGFEGNGEVLWPVVPEQRYSCPAADVQTSATSDNQDAGIAAESLADVRRKDFRQSGRILWPSA